MMRKRREKFENPKEDGSDEEEEYIEEPRCQKNMCGRI
jgi:hypothetical protein